ncbi:MAG: hypothetical protein HYR95_01315 [Candidatus Colwellbacteria bacterium]|nr:hypothetical protein [Candidatus Colwellbacteria bacterium]
MLNYFTPTIIVAFTMLILLLLLLIGLNLPKFLRERSRKWHRLIIFEVPSEKAKEAFSKIVNDLKAPFAFEMAVHHLGKGVHYYVLVPEPTREKVAGIIEGNIVSDYSVYHPGGGNSYAYFKGGKTWSDFDYTSVDFSRVNEIGESVVLQFLIKENGKQNMILNIRAAASAPTPYQSQEIIAGLKSSLSGFRFLEPKSNNSFVQKFNSREFGEREAVQWLKS